MNIKKYLKKRAEEDAENLITEADRQFCWELAEKNVAEYMKAKEEAERIKEMKKMKKRERREKRKKSRKNQS